MKKLILLAVLAVAFIQCDLNDPGGPGVPIVSFETVTAPYLATYGNPEIESRRSIGPEYVEITWVWNSQGVGVVFVNDGVDQGVYGWEVWQNFTFPPGTY